MRIYLIGFMGAGKTHWAQQLGKKLGVPVFDLDDLIESDENRTVAEIFDQQGEEYFRTKEREILHWVSETHSSMVLSCGGGAPCFYNNIKYMNEKGITVWIDTPYEILLGRLRHNQDSRPLLKHLDDEELKAYIQKKNTDRRIFYEQAKVRLSEADLSINHFIKQLFNE